MTPEPLLLSFYGDDLTGATDVMEALASHGASTVLYTQIPTPAQRARFARVRAIGLAGASRSETPAWMEENLPPALGWLKDLGASVCHYKVCSTFDSSPEIGSIGCAIEIGQRLFAQGPVPLVVGAPQLKRYTAFGHLFAANQGEVYRIDRHPVMSRHPVTPMHESDLRLHLARQTDKSIGLVDLATLARSDADVRVDAILSSGAEIVLFDVSDALTQNAVGRQLGRLLSHSDLFIAGSSGVEYALLRAWERTGAVPGRCDFPSPGAVDRIAVVSGSCSATTARQIRHATTQGFDGVVVDPKSLARGDEMAIQEAIATAGASLARGRSVIVYSALGPESDVGAEFLAHGARGAIGKALGRIERALVAQAGLRRVVISGGDTSSHALAELGVYALTTLLPLPATPGSPLCLAASDEPGIDGLQIALKGGQVGGDDYFVRIRDGAA